MEKFEYVLMTNGIRDVIDDETGNSAKWNVPHYSKVKYVMAKDEDMARKEIRAKLKKKWVGFRLLRNEVN